MCFSFSAIQQAAEGRIRRTYNSGKFILFTSVPGASLDALICFTGYICSHYLDYLNYNDRQQDAYPSDIVVASLVAVDDGDLAEAGAAYRGSHGRVAEDRDIEMTAP